MSDRARELAERISLRLSETDLVGHLEDGMNDERGTEDRMLQAAVADVIAPWLADFEHTAEQRGYDAGLEQAAQVAETIVAPIEILPQENQDFYRGGRNDAAKRIRSLIGSSPAPDTDRDERLARWFVLRENPDILPSLLDHVVKRDLARFRESEAKRTEAK